MIWVARHYAPGAADKDRVTMCAYGNRDVPLASVATRPAPDLDAIAPWRGLVWVIVGSCLHRRNAAGQTKVVVVAEVQDRDPRRGIDACHVRFLGASAGRERPTRRTRPGMLPHQASVNLRIRMFTSCMGSRQRG